MKMPSPKRRKGQRGHTMLESLLFLFGSAMLIGGVIELSRIAYAYNTVSQISRSATRYASSHLKASSEEVVRFAVSEAANLDPKQLMVSTTWNPPDKSPGSVVTVEVNYIQFPLMDFVVPNNIQLSSKCQMVVTP